MPKGAEKDINEDILTRFACSLVAWELVIGGIADDVIKE